jgi:hypothetical protein
MVIVPGVTVTLGDVACTAIVTVVAVGGGGGGGGGGVNEDPPPHAPAPTTRRASKSARMIPYAGRVGVVLLK